MAEKERSEKLSVAGLEKQLLSGHFFVNVCKKVRQRFPGSIVVVNQTIPSGDKIQIRYEEGMGSILDAAANGIGRRLEDMSMKATKEALTVMPLGKVFHLYGGIYQLALGELPQSIATFIEKIFSINKIYAVAFVRNNIILATIVLILRHKEDISEEGKLELEKFAEDCTSLLVKLNGMKRVLFVDDEESIREMVIDLLSSEGIDIAVAANGKEAVKAYKQQLQTGYKYDAVITDMNLGRGIKGLEAAMEIQKLDPAAALIFCTANSTDKLMVEYKQYGYRAVLAKPFTIDEIKEAIRIAIV